MRYGAVRLPGPQGGRHHRAVRGTGDPAHVVAVRFELHLPNAQSLKEKRATIRPILDGARNRYRVAAAEVDQHDKWQRAALGIAVVAGTETHAEEVADAVERFVWSFPEVAVLSADRSWVET